MENIENLENLKRERVSLIEKMERLGKDSEQQRTFSDKNLAELRSSFDAFWFLIFGSFLGLSISLLANIIHDYFSILGIKYYVGVVVLLILSFYLIIFFLIRKFNRIIKSDELLRDIVDDKDDFIESMQGIRSSLDQLKDKYTKLLQK